MRRAFFLGLLAAGSLLSGAGHQAKAANDAPVPVRVTVAQTTTTHNCPQSGMMHNGGMMHEGMMMQGMHGAADRAFMQSMMSMHEGMRGQAYTGDPDHDFMVMMIPHHQAAIDMAKAELKYGKNSKLRAMAQSIVKAQQAEIDQMRAMLQ